MIKSLSIRYARLNDVEVLTTIRHKAILTLAAEKMGTDQASDWANSATPNRICCAIKDHLVFVAEIAKEPVGWVEVASNRIEGLYVRPEQAHQGVGSALLAHVEAQIWSANYQSVVLDASWNAEQFYLNRGYQPLAERSPETGRPMVKLLTSDSVLNQT